MIDLYYTSSTSPLATSCSTTEYGTNEMWPFSISKAVPLDNIEFSECQFEAKGSLLWKADGRTAL
jgi:hypothetical protein